MKPDLLQRALEPANLRLAWGQVAANKGAAGADDVTIRWFARDWEANLMRLRESVLTYQKCFEVQARQLRKVIEGAEDEYQPFRTR